MARAGQVIAGASGRLAALRATCTHDRDDRPEARVAHPGVHDGEPARANRHQLGADAAHGRIVGQGQCMAHSLEHGIPNNTGQSL